MTFLYKNAATFIFPVAAFLLVLCTSRNHDPGITSDSAFYLETAGNIISGKGLTDDYGRVNAHWPPLYPIVLAGASRVTGMDCITSGKFLNALIIGLMFLVFNLILAKILITSWFRWTSARTPCRPNSPRRRSRSAPSRPA